MARRSGNDRRPRGAQGPKTKERPSSQRADSGQSRAAKTVPSPAPAKAIEIPETISVRELSELMDKSLIDVIKHLMGEGIMANINQQLDHDIAAMIAEDMGFQIKEPQIEEEPEEQETEEKAPPKRVYTPEEQERLVARPPVVTVLGHVDHGKTALLDAIREANVAAGEAGGITQRVGAYQVTKQGRKITFLDTPGHEAFTAMRARGAQVTDMAILVVAADDGVMPQTIEAINHAKAAHVPIIVAINKIDKPNANPDLVKQQLSDAGLIAEEWGGETIMVEVSALMQVGVDAILDMVLLVADMAELKALPDVPAQGTVIDARVDRAMGPIATMLVQEGTLRAGDSLVIGGIAGRVRAMFDYQMQRIDEAPPSTPAAVIGLPELPAAGDKFHVVEDDKTARAKAQSYLEQQTVRATSSASKATTLDEIMSQIKAGEAKELNLIIKTDIQGSIEPIVNSVEQLSMDEVKVNILHTATGSVSEYDVMLASASGAIIIAFDVDISPVAARQAETEGVSIRQYKIIYRLIEDVDKALKGMLEPEYRDVIIGRGRVLATFSIPRIGLIAGAQMVEGRALRNATVRVLRDGRKLHEGRLSSLKRFTEDVREVTTGMEFGVGVADFHDFDEGDIIEFYTRERVNVLV